MRTIPDNNKLLVPIEDNIRNQFKSTFTGNRICSEEEERKLLSLHVAGYAVKRNVKYYLYM